MKNIIVNDNLYISQYSGEDLINNLDNIIEKCMPILNSHEDSDSFEDNYDKFTDLIQNFAYDCEKCSLYVLNDKQQPVSFAMFSDLAEKTQLLELIMTKQDKMGSGYAKELLISAMKDLRKTGEETLVSHFNINNEESIAFHQKLLKLGDACGRIYKDYENICSCEFDLKAFDKSLDESQIF